jgi:LysM repeat protein
VLFLNDKKYKATMSVIAGLMVLSGGLFVYENVYLVKQKEANQATIFVAKKDIQAHTSIDASMFEPVKIPKDYVLPSYVVNINSVVGKELKGGLLKGEPLTVQRLEDKGSYKEGNLLLEIVPDFAGNIQPNDNVKVYVRLTNQDTGESTVKELFKQKKVLPTEKETNALLNTGNNNVDNDKERSFAVKATEKEVKDYYVAKKSGEIIVVKIGDLDTQKITSSQKGEVGKFDANSEEVKNASRPDETDDEGQAVMTYTVKEGDTLDSLSLKFKTKKETIMALNNGKTVFEEGEVIQVPAN